MREWYVGDDGQAIDWDTILDGDGLLTGNVYRLVERSPGAEPMRLRWGATGQAISGARVEAAQSVESGDSIPASHVPVAPPRGGAGELAPLGRNDYWEQYLAPIVLTGGNDLRLTSDDIGFVGDDGLIVELDEPIDYNGSLYYWQVTRDVLLNFDIDIEGASDHYRLVIRFASPDKPRDTPSVAVHVSGDARPLMVTGLMREGDLIEMYLSDPTAAGDDVTYFGVYLDPLIGY